MSDAGKPPAPVGLGTRGRRFWRDVTGGFELNRDELELLTEICRTLDEIETLRQVIDTEGVTVEGSKGQTRVHPAFSQMRASRSLLGRLVAQLGLPDPEGAAVPSLLSVRGKRGAESRWRQANAARQAREDRRRGSA